MPFKTIIIIMSIKKNTLDTITPNKTWQIYRKFKLCPKIWWETLGSGSGGQPPTNLQTQIQSFKAYHLGQRAFQQIRKINTCKEIKPGQLRDEGKLFSYSLSLPSQLSSLPPHLHLKQLPWCLGIPLWCLPLEALPCPDGLLKNAEMPGRVISHPKALKWIWLSRSHLFGTKYSVGKGHYK